MTNYKAPSNNVTIKEVAIFVGIPVLFVILTLPLKKGPLPNAITSPQQQYQKAYKVQTELTCVTVDNVSRCSFVFDVNNVKGLTEEECIESHIPFHTDEAIRIQNGCRVVSKN